MKKIIALLAVIMMSMTFAIVDAKPQQNFLSKSITNNTTLSKNAISVSVKQINGNKTYNYNEDKLLPIASVQKLITMIPAFKTLGDDYNFSTKLYKSNTGAYYVVLGADPYLTQKDLNALISHIKLPKDYEIQEFYVDSSVVDDIEWGEGWQWDDDLNPYTPKYSAFNIDKNMLTINVLPMEIGSPALIRTSKFYPVNFINKTVTVPVENGNNITIDRKNYVAQNDVIVEGTIAKNQNVTIPCNNIRKYFMFRLEEAIAYNKVGYYKKIQEKQLPKTGVTLIGEIKHPISLAKTDVFFNSNNLVAESTFKLAGGKYTNSVGTTEKAIKMVLDYDKKNNLDTTEIRITDGSGVSKNNLLNVDFVTSFLSKELNTRNDEEYKNLLPTSGEGTLSKRLPMLKNKLYAKTGTLSNISSIAGFVETKKGNKYTFCIIINDAKTSEANKKFVEDNLIRDIYNNL